MYKFDNLEILVTLRHDTVENHPGRDDERRIRAIQWGEEHQKVDTCNSLAEFSE
uniref:Uncharacterized protein n=1 Tax=Arion vulgaris TaxID=1028688 RepID=A0A0B7AXG8_9EUPU